jgi:hypothetical protein
MEIWALFVEIHNFKKLGLKEPLEKLEKMV